MIDALFAFAVLISIMAVDNIFAIEATLIIFVQIYLFDQFMEFVDDCYYGWLKEVTTKINMCLDHARQPQRLASEHRSYVCERKRERTV